MCFRRTGIWSGLMNLTEQHSMNPPGQENPVATAGETMNFNIIPIGL